MSPVPGMTSPVRPQDPDPPRERILPSVPRPSRPVPPTSTKDPTPTEEIDLMALSAEDRAANALERLRQKMIAVTEEYAQGQINRAQFHAIYQRYQEQRTITEQLLKRDPQSGAWQSVVRPGHTSFLRDHFQSKIQSYAIYDIQTGHQIALSGSVQLAKEQVLPIIAKLKDIINKHGNPGPASRRLKDDRWVLFMPALYTIAVAVFSLEPADAQIKQIEDIQNDFERANRQVLQSHILDRRQMVFPHRALFEN